MKRGLQELDDVEVAEMVDELYDLLKAIEDAFDLNGLRPQTIQALQKAGAAIEEDLYEAENELDERGLE